MSTLAPVSSHRRIMRSSPSWPSRRCAEPPKLPAGSGTGRQDRRRKCPASDNESEDTMAERIIELRDIKKSYGQVYALGGVNLSVDRGEVVGLIGDNGAGKSTLIKILSGVVKPTSGEILVRGKPVTGWSAARSRDAGIENVFQDRALAVQQTIVRNIFMGRELTGFLGWLKVGKEIEEASRLSP